VIIKPIKSLHKALALLTIAGLSGCASIDKTPHPFMDRDDLERKMVELESERSDLITGQPLVQDIDTPFLGTSERSRVIDSAGLPVHLDQHVEWFDARPYMLEEAAEKISSLTGIRTRVRGQPSANQLTTSSVSSPSSYLSADDAILSTLYAEGSVAPQNAIQINHEGTLSRLLDKMASRFNVGWEYANDEIRFYYSSTRVFQIAALPGSVSQSSTLSNASGGGGSGDDYVAATGGLSTAYEFSENTWDSIELSLQSILTGGGEFQVNPGNSSIVVTARRNEMEEVESYVDSLNEIYKRQVALEVNVYTLQMSEDDSRNFSLNAAYNDLSSQYGLTIDALTGSGNNLGNQFTATVLEGNSRFEGSELLFDVLNQWGNASIVTSASGVVLNGQPFPVQDVNRQSYLASSETTFQDGIAQTSLEPGEVTTGFSMQVLPQIMGDDDMLLQYSFTLSTLKDIREFSSGDSSIQLPNVDDRSFTQRTKMPINSTLVLAGYQRDEDSLDRSAGVGGYRRGAEQGKTMVFVTISASRQ